MRSKKLSLNIPHKLLEAYEKHAREMGYECASQMLIWSPVYSLMLRRAHLITAPLSHLPRDAQDVFVDELVDNLDKPPAESASYMERLLAEVIKKFGLPVPPGVVAAMLADAVKSVPPKSSEPQTGPQ